MDGSAMVHYLKVGLMLGALAGSAMAWAGEIVIFPPKNDAPSSETQATRLREAARAERKDQSPVTSSVIIMPEEDEGVLSPRRSTGASENRARARASRKDEDATEIYSPLILVPAPPVTSSVPSAAQSARTNRERAIEYRKGDHDHPHSSNAKDGLPIIDCEANGNVSGRIGDDTRSGNVVTLIQDRQQVRVRCR